MFLYCEYIFIFKPKTKPSTLGEKYTYTGHIPKNSENKSSFSYGYIEAIRGYQRTFSPSQFYFSLCMLYPWVDSPFNNQGPPEAFKAPKRSQFQRQRKRWQKLRSGLASIMWPALMQSPPPDRTDPVEVMAGPPLALFWGKNWLKSSQAKYSNRAWVGTEVILQ